MTEYSKDMRKEKLLPIHPGEILREELLKPYHISVEKLAERTKIKEERIRKLVEERENIDADISYRLGRYFSLREDY